MHGGNLKLIIKLISILWSNLTRVITLCPCNRNVTLKIDRLPVETCSWNITINILVELGAFCRFLVHVVGFHFSFCVMHFSQNDNARCWVRESLSSAATERLISLLGHDVFKLRPCGLAFETAQASIGAYAALYNENPDQCGGVCHLNVLILCLLS